MEENNKEITTNTDRAQAKGVSEVAKELNVSRITVLRWIHAKKIEGFFRIGHKWLIRREDLDAFINGKISQNHD